MSTYDSPYNESQSADSQREGQRRTLGGKQFWTDWLSLDGWRVQKFYRGGRARLLDPQNRLVSSGSFEKCEQRFRDLVSRNIIKKPKGDVAILLHGLARTRNSLWRLEENIRQRTDFCTVRLQYASTRARLDDHARALANALAMLDEDSTIHFVAHSMGNLVVRRMLFDQAHAEKSTKPTPKYGRMVMIGPPNQGSEMARWLKYSLLFNSIAGVGGREFSWNWDEVAPKLAIPEFEFGVIAGAQQRLRFLSNPLLDGTDDWAVRTAETSLDGEQDRLEGPFLHGAIMNNRKVIDATLNFLRHGYFSGQNKS
jgi:pimeloyl-ACP methyl ester carboxylesterase